MRQRIEVEKARKLLCPFVQHASLVASSIVPGNSDLLAFEDKHVPANTDCVANRCMAWHDCGGDMGYCNLISDDR